MGSAKAVQLLGCGIEAHGVRDVEAKDTCIRFCWLATVFESPQRRDQDVRMLTISSQPVLLNVQSGNPERLYCKISNPCAMLIEVNLIPAVEDKPSGKLRPVESG